MSSPHHLKLAGLHASRTKAWLVFWHPSKRGCPQANRVTLATACRRDNSVGDDFEHQFRLTGIVKLLAGSLESLTHRRNRLKFERCVFRPSCRLYERTVRHGRFLRIAPHLI